MLLVQKGDTLICIIEANDVQEMIVEADYEFTKVIVKLPNGEIVEGEVEEWTTYDAKDMVKVKIKGGKQYLGHSNNIVLYND